MFREISASNGGGYVPASEVAEALGAYILGSVMRYELEGAEGTLTIVRIDNVEDVYLWHYKGREWRITHLGVSLHFDYIKDA